MPIVFVVVLQAPTYHLIFEALLIIWIVKLMFAKSYAPDKTVLTEKVGQFPPGI